MLGTKLKGEEGEQPPIALPLCLSAATLKPLSVVFYRFDRPGFYRIYKNQGLKIKNGWIAPAG